MLRRSFTFLGSITPTLIACHGTPDAKAALDRPTPQPLRLEAMTFYEAGFAWFERAGTTEGASPLALVVPEQHLGDALRTLVVLSETRAPTLEFESVVPLELARVRAGFVRGSTATHENVLESLEGAEVEVETTKGKARGRLLNEANGFFTIVGGASGVLQFSSSELERIRPTDPRRRALLDRALSMDRSELGTRERLLYVPGKAGPLRLGYVAETPAWAPSYRLVLPASGTRARLQGSALLHNDTEEAWSKIRVTLASSRPSSYIHAWREDVPETSLGTIGAMVDRRGEDPEGSFEYPAIGALSVRPHHGALVPFLDVPVDSVPVVWFTDSEITTSRVVLDVPARRALEISNTTTQTFPGGIVSVFTAKGFAGETTLKRLLPGGHTFLPYAAELDVSVETPTSTKTDVPIDVTFDGMLTQKRRIRYERKYVVENRRAEPVSVYVSLGLPVVTTTQGFDRYRDDVTAGVIEAPMRSKAERAIVIEAEEIAIQDAENLTADEFRELADAPTLAKYSGILHAALTLIERIAENTAQTESADERVNALSTDLETARGDLSQSAGGPAGKDLVQRLFAVQKSYDAASARADTLRGEGERLGEALRRELSKLPKPRPAG